MKVDVVLYNGENDAAEHVGACVERDLLGIRDPHEPDVPETMAETRARERKERQREEIGDLSVTSGSIKAKIRCRTHLPVGPDDSSPCHQTC